MTRAVLLLFTLLLLPLTSYAETGTEANPSVRVSLGGGILDLRESTGTTWQLAVEGKVLKTLWNVRPTLVAIDGGDSSYYVGIGALKEFPLNRHWQPGLGLAAGRYDQGDSNRNLGKTLEFHTRTTFDYQATSRDLLRIEPGHLCNARLALHARCCALWKQILNMP